MKVKKDKFLEMACADLDLETATREHYGYKNKGSTATDASYTIAPKARVASRIGSSKRRGFMSARPNSVQKGTQANKSDSVKAMLGRKAKKSMKAGKSYVTTAEGEYDEKEEEEKEERENIDTPEDLNIIRDIKKKEAGVGATDAEEMVYSALKAMGKAPYSLNTFIKQFRKTMNPEPKARLTSFNDRVARRYNKRFAVTPEDVLEHIGTTIPIEERQKRAAKGEDIIKTEEQKLINKRQMQAFVEEQKQYIKRTLPVIKELRAAAAAKKRSLSNDEAEELMGLLETKPFEPVKKEDLEIPKDPTPRVKTKKLKQLPPYTSEQIARMSQEPTFENKELSESENELKAWAIMQWIAQGGAGEIAQSLINNMRETEKRNYAMEKAQLRKRFNVNVPIEVPASPAIKKEEAVMISGDIRKATEGILSPEERAIIFDLVLPRDKQNLYTLRDKLLSHISSRAGKSLYDRVSQSDSFKALTKDSTPMEVGAGFIWGPEGAKERKKKYQEAQALRDVWYKEKGKSQRRIFDREAGTRAKEAMGVYGKTDFDRDMSDMDSTTLLDGTDNVYSWENTPMGSGPTQTKRVITPEMETRRAIQSAMHTPEIRYKMEQYAAIKERMGEMVDRKKLRFLLAMKKHPELASAAENNIPGGYNMIIAELNDAFKRGNAELFAGPIARINPFGRSQIPETAHQSGLKHVGALRRYLTILKHAIPTSKELTLNEKTAGGEKTKEDKILRSFLGTYKDIIGDIEGKLWANNNNYKLLSDQLANAKTNEEVLALERKLDILGQEHKRLINDVAEHTKGFFQHEYTPKILNRVYKNNPMAGQFMHKKVKFKTSPERVLKRAKEIFGMNSMSPSTYEILYPERIKDERKRAHDTTARLKKQAYIDGESPTLIPSEAETIKRDDYRRVMAELPELYAGNKALKSYAIGYPDFIPPLSKEDLMRVTQLTGTPTPNAAQVFSAMKKLNSEIENQKDMLPISYLARYLKGTKQEQDAVREIDIANTVAEIKQLGAQARLPEDKLVQLINHYITKRKKSSISDMDIELMLNAIIPNNASYAASEAGGLVTAGHKEDKKSLFKESKIKEEVANTTNRRFIDLGTLGGEAHNWISKNTGYRQLGVALDEIENGYRKAALETPDRAGEFNAYADYIQKFRNLNPKSQLEKIIELTNRKTQSGNHLGLSNSAYLNISKLLYSITEDAPIKPYETDEELEQWTPLERELWGIGLQATGHGPAGTMHGIWKRYLPYVQDKNSAAVIKYVKNAIEDNVPPLYHLWLQRYKEKIPDELKDRFIDDRSSLEDAVLKLQGPKRGEEESPENEIRRRIISELNPPKTASGQPAREYETITTTPKIEEPKIIAPPQENIAPQPIPEASNPNPVPSTNSGASPKLKDLGNTPRQTPLSETADVVDRFLLQNKKLEIVTQGGEGSGEPIIGVGKTWHGEPGTKEGLAIFQRRGAPRKMEALQPNSISTNQIAQNTIPPTNAKNNKPGLDTGYRTTPGGGQPGSICDKYLRQINMRLKSNV